MAGMDRELGAPIQGAYEPRMVDRALERTSGRRADGDDTAALSTRGIDGARGRFGNHDALGRHGVVFDALALDRTERARADVQRDRVNLDRSHAQAGEDI